MALKIKNVRAVKECYKKSIAFDDYRECLFSSTKQQQKMNVMRSHCHEIYTEQINKIALFSDEDKRFIMADCLQTLAYDYTIFKKVVIKQ